LELANPLVYFSTRCWNSANVCFHHKAYRYVKVVGEGLD
jgi:hypothetical protein